MERRNIKGTVFEYKMKGEGKGIILKGLYSNLNWRVEGRNIILKGLYSNINWGVKGSNINGTVFEYKLKGEGKEY